MSKPVCAITGASGYVGSRLAAGLAPDFDILTLGRAAGADGRSIGWRMGEKTSVAEALRDHKVEVLVHAAWDFRHPHAAENWNINVLGSRQLVEDAQSAGVRRLIFVSTISAFEGAVSEYGKSKLAVEKLFLGAGGTVIRPGLVWGERPGGVFGSMRQQVAKGGIVPVIGDGSYPQYLVHEDDLAEALRRVARGGFEGRLLTVAHPQGVAFGDLILKLAGQAGKQVRLVHVPWRFVHTGLKGAETLGLKLNFRSDSVISLVTQNRNPVFDAEDPVRLRPFV